MWISLFQNKKAQVMLEFIFCMIILFLMMYAIIMIFRWVGSDLVLRQESHDAMLQANIDMDYGNCMEYEQLAGCKDSEGDCFICAVGASPDCFYFGPNCVDFRNMTRGPLSQIDPYFFEPSPMNAVWEGN